MTTHRIMALIEDPFDGDEQDVRSHLSNKMETECGYQFKGLEVKEESDEAQKEN